MSGCPSLDEAYAESMRSEGISYRKIGIEIARREGRKVPYQANSIYIAVNRFRKLLNAPTSGTDFT